MFFLLEATEKETTSSLTHRNEMKQLNSLYARAFINELAKNKRNKELYMPRIYEVKFNKFKVNLYSIFFNSVFEKIIEGCFQVNKLVRELNV